MSKSRRSKAESWEQQKKRLQREAGDLAKMSTDALLARSRPLTAAERREWTTKVRGRPRKPSGDRAVRVLFTIDPKLLRQVDAYARAKDLSRAELIAASLRRAMKAG